MSINNLANVMDMLERQVYMEMPEFHCVYQVILMMINTDLISVDDYGEDAQGDLIEYIKSHALSIKNA